MPSKPNTNKSTSPSNASSKMNIFKKNGVMLKKLSIKDDIDNPLSPKSPIFATLQNIPVLKRSGSRVAIYAKEEMETQTTPGRDCQTNPVSGDYLYMTAQVGTDVKGIYGNITLGNTEKVCAAENKINQKLLEEDHYQNIEIIRRNCLMSKKPPIVVQINKKPIPALRQKTSK